MKKSEAIPLLDAVAEVVKQYVDEKIAEVPAGKEGPAGAPGERGRDADPEVVRSMVEAAVAALPPARDGARGEKGDSGERGEQGQPGQAGEKGEPGDPGERGEKGTDGKDGRDGREGKDGADGQPGRDALEFEILPDIDSAKSYPRGTFARFRGGLARSVRTTDPLVDGHLATAGWEVVVEGVAAVVVTQAEDLRTFTVSTMLSSGLRAETAFTVPVVLERGVWREGPHAQGDGVTWDGSYWIALRATNAKPGTSPDWRLAVKRGRDGRDAGAGPSTPRGPVRVG